MATDKVRGTRDFYPEDKRVLNYIFNSWKSVAESFGYEEVDGPILEPVELYRKSGQEVPEQMYRLTDKANRELVLRPETTPTVARMISARRDLQKPIKWYSVSRCLRYEAPQSGRLREFFQFNLDVLGSRSMMADAEAITTAVRIMEKFGLTRKDFYVRISNRKLAEAVILDAGVEKNKLKEVYRLIDKLGKITEKDFVLSLKDIGVNGDGLLKALKADRLDDLNNYDGAGELRELFSFLKKFKVDKYCVIDLTIMRGFDYYTSTIFEVFDATKELRAIAGGGRYDELAPNCPGIGYGMGDVVLELLLRKKGKIKKLDKDIDYFVAYVDSSVLDKAIEISEKLRERYKVEMDVSMRNLGKQFKYANSVKAKKVIVVGPDELKQGKVVVRDMTTGKEEKKDISKLT